MLTSGAWTNGANWSGGVPPVSGERTDIGNPAASGVTATIGPGDSAEAGIIYLGVDTLTASGGVVITGGSLTGSGTFHVGLNATGTVNQTGGVVTVPRLDVGGDQAVGDGRYDLSGGTLTIANGGPAYIASHPAARGAFVMTGGSIDASGDWWVGPDGVGSMVQQGGTNTVQGRFRLADHGKGQGSYTLSGDGVLIVTNGLAYAGTDSARTGVFNHVSGTACFKELHIGSYGPGEYHLSGGELHAADFYQGYHPHSVFTFTGGALDANRVHFGFTNAGGRLGVGMTNGLGRLQVNGDYTVAASNATLDVQLGGIDPGTTYDWLSVSGRATLGGALNVSLVNGFMPPSGESFRIITAGSVNGVFTNAPVSGQVYDLGGISTKVTYTPTAVILANTNALLLWLTADAITEVADGQLIDRWPDRSGAGRDAVQAGPEKPLYVAHSALAGNHPVVRFLSTTMTYLEVPDRPVWQPEDFTFSAVVMFDSEPGNWYERAILAQDPGNGNQPKWIWSHNVGTIWHINNPGIGQAQFEGHTWTPAYTNHLYLLSLSRQGDVYRFFRDGAEDGVVTNALPIPDAPCPLRIGWGEGSVTFAGDVAELRVYGRALGQTDRQRLEGELAWKYGLQANLPPDHPYRNYNPVQRTGMRILIR